MKRLIILSGIPASGKTTYIENNFPNAEVISTDRTREELNGTASDLSNDEQVWEIVHKRIAESSSKVVVVDATNLTDRRLSTYFKYKDIYDSLELIRLCVDFDTALERNCRRERHVPYDAMLRMRELFNRGVSKEILEQFNKVVVVNNS